MTKERKELGKRKHNRVEFYKRGFLIPTPDAPWIECTIVDVSDSGDWSSVRVWWPPSAQMGLAEYPVHGFIQPDHPAQHDRLVAETPAAIRLATGR